MIRKLSLPSISSSEDLDVHLCVRVRARGLPLLLAGTALASVLAPSSVFPPTSREKTLARPPSSQATHPAGLSPLSPLLLRCESSPCPVRPWSEVKSRRGAPKRVNTEGFACPDEACAYARITDAQIHALVGDGKHGQAERIQTFCCQACRTTFSARRDTPSYRLKTPSRAGSPSCCQP